MNILDKLINFFMNSNIYEEGSYRAYYSIFKKGPFYPEITAYAISLCCILYNVKKENIFLERAQICSKYMMSKNIDGGIRGIDGNILYTFDTGIYISSMFDLFNITKNEIYKNEAIKSLKWICSMWDGKKFKPTNTIIIDNNWYNSSSVHLSKIVIPILKAYINLNDNKYKIIAVKLLNEYKKLQTDKGNFLINKEINKTLIHPHCYATEAFLFAYYTLKKSEYLNIIDNSINWLSKIQNSDGSFYDEYIYNTKMNNTIPNQKKIKRTDATAQITRIWKVMGKNEDGINKAYNFLNKQIDNKGLKLFNNSRLGYIFPKLYSWPLFFYIHSLLIPFGQIKSIEEVF